MAKPEIERKFLVTRSVPLDHARQARIEQGYLFSERGREMRVRRQGLRHFLTVKEGQGRSRAETEISLTGTQFAALWPLTAAARVAKTRHTFKHDGHTFEVDIYEGRHSPLRVAEIEFPSEAASHAFRKPSFLGKEVTGREEYSNASLARHGLPVPRDGTCRAGALPFFFKKGQLHIVLVTSSSGNRWIVPKGQLEANMTRQEVALMEAAEEAGVVGTIESGIHVQSRLEDGRLLHLYPLRVFAVLKHWPEASTRKRLILPLDKAIQEIEDKSLARAIPRLAARLEE